MYAFASDLVAAKPPRPDPNDRLMELTAVVEAARKRYQESCIQQRSLAERMQAWDELEAAKNTLRTALSEF